MTTCQARDELVLWPDLVDLLRFSGRKRLTLDGREFALLGGSYCATDGGKDLIPLFKSCDTILFDRLLQDLQLAFAAINCPEFAVLSDMLTTEEIKKLAQSSLIEIGSHGMTHQSFVACGLDQSSREA